MQVTPACGGRVETAPLSGQSGADLESAVRSVSRRYDLRIFLVEFTAFAMRV